MLRENGKYLPKQSYMMRKHYFNNTETGILDAGKKKATAPPNPMTDPSMMTEMFKGNLTNMVPMVVVGGWINWHFSGKQKPEVNLKSFGVDQLSPLLQYIG